MNQKEEPLMKNIIRTHRTGALLLALVLALTLSLGAAAMAAGSRSDVTDETIDRILNTATDASQVTSPFISVSESVRTSVVGIKNYQLVRSNSYDYYNFPFGFGFGGYGRGNDRGQEPSEQLYATGSGVCVTEYGHVLTNYHVVENASRLTVTVENSDQEYEAKVVAYDEDKDVAVLYVENLPVQPVALGDSDQLQVGEWAIVIGNPLSEVFARTVTIGVVSALDREITDTTYDMFGRRSNVTNNMIQVDAAINSGNSGGGMFNTLGQLMGIPARKYSSSGFSSASVENIGLCIPINVAKPLIRSALENYSKGIDTVTARSESQVTGNRPMLGVTVTTLSASEGSRIPQGAFVMEVSQESNASRAGIQVGDIITAVNDTKITSHEELVQVIRTFNEGDVLTVSVTRIEGLNQAVQHSTLDESQLGASQELTLTVTLRAGTAA